MPAEAPSGSFANGGHDAPHAHFVVWDKSGNHLLHTDLARDSIFVWQYNKQTCELSELPIQQLFTSSGSGARHLAFQPDGTTIYAITEESSQIYTYGYQKKTGTLTEKQKISSLPRAFKGTNYASDMFTTSNGQFVLAANRLHNSISVFSTNPSSGVHRLSFQSNTPTLGDYPRSMCLSPNEKFLYISNQLSDVINVFAFNSVTGALTPTEHYIPFGSPAKLVFIQP